MAHQGSGRAFAGSLIFVGIIAVLILGAEATAFNVGDGDGDWEIPTSVNGKKYQLWASSTTFSTGDDIIFRYDPAVHSVLRVKPEAYEECNSTSPTQIYHPEDGFLAVHLEFPGVYYFICGEAGHCVLGQRFSVNVREAAAAMALKCCLWMIVAVVGLGSSLLFL